MTNKKVKSKVHVSPIQVKTIILSIVIAIVLTSFVIYLIQAIYTRSDYEDYCGKIRPISVKENQEITQELCEEQDGKWIPQDVICVTTPCPQGYCDYYSDCQREYDFARDKYKLVVFIVAVISGLMAVSAGIILSLPSVSSGLMLGGTFLTLYGTGIYWSNLSNWLKAIVLGLVLVILIWLGYKKLRN